MRLRSPLLFILGMLLTLNPVLAQDRFVPIEAKLKELSQNNPGLNEKVELSVNGVAIYEFIRGIAISNNINVNVDPVLNTRIVNNFSNVTVTDVLLFLCREYNLDITFIGNIISITAYQAPALPPPTYVAKTLKISFDAEKNLLNLDLNNDSLALVARELTKATGKNVVFAADISNRTVSAFIQNMPFDAALDKLAFANDLKITPTDDNFYLIEKEEVTAEKQNKGGKNGGSFTPTPGLNVKLEQAGHITVDAVNVPVASILAAASDQLNISYFLFAEPKGNTSLNIRDASYEEFLKYLFNGTETTFKKEGEIYLIGDRTTESLRATKVVELKYRTVEKLNDFLPSDLKKGVEIKLFPDLNSLILSGSQPQIEELEGFIRTIDRVVPVIAIEVMIVDARKSHTVTTGIKAGLGDKPAVNGGEIFPSTDVTLNANILNSIINGINGFGVVNLGNVGPNFYLTLQASEQNGDIKIRSTPRLATLNGHEAKMSIGETRYYLEQTSNIITTQSTTTVNSQQYKPISADMELVINPIVSGDEQVTLEITFNQSSFTEQTAGKNSPFGTITRDFKSLIRVKNGEMIILGGLEEHIKNDTGSGTPILSRIPVIKWLFSSRRKATNKNKLVIFIKPTVIY